MKAKINFGSISETVYQGTIKFFDHAMCKRTRYVVMVF